MRIGLFLALLANLFSYSAPATELSPEAVQCFEWFSGLAYPDVSGARWVKLTEIKPAALPKHPEIKNTRYGFVLEAKGGKMRILQPNLLEEAYIEEIPSHIGFQPFAYKEISFSDTAQEALVSSANPTVEIGQEELDRKAQLFFYAFACWRRGEPELAQKLFDVAVKQMPNLPLWECGLRFVPPMRETLEREFGDAAFKDAILQFSGRRFEKALDSISNHFASRKSLLQTLREAIRRFPKSHFTARAKVIAETLKSMVEEDAEHAAPDAEAVQKLPIEKRVAELIFQIRDQCGHYVPQGTDYYDIFSEVTGAPDPARQLARIGVPAVEQLISSLDDGRLSRCARVVGFGSEMQLEILTVGQCAELALEKIAGRRFRPLRGNAPEPRGAIAIWWKDVQTKGEKQTLVDDLSSTQFDPAPLVARLSETYPDTIEDALIAGTLRVKSVSPFGYSFVHELGCLVTPRTTATLLKLLNNGAGNTWLRVPAARQLIARGNPEALPGVELIWQTIPIDPPKDYVGNVLYGEYFDTALAVLLASGKADAEREVIEAWDRRWPAERFKILHQIFIQLGGRDGTNKWGGLERKPLEKAASALSIALLAHALGDKTVAVQNAPETLGAPPGTSTIVNQPNPTSPSAANRRNCDMALKFLSELEPDNYRYSSQATLEECDMECARAAERWRKSQQDPDNPIAAIDLQKLFSGAK